MSKFCAVNKFDNVSFVRILFRSAESYAFSFASSRLLCAVSREDAAFDNSAELELICSAASAALAFKVSIAVESDTLPSCTFSSALSIVLIPVFTLVNVADTVAAAVGRSSYVLTVMPSALRPANCFLTALLNALICCCISGSCAASGLSLSTVVMLV